jgi:hypothetical protein
VPVNVTVVPLEPVVGTSMNPGTTVNGVDGLLIASDALTLNVPDNDAGTLKSALNEPDDFDVTAAGVVVRATPLNLNVIVFSGVKLMPVALMVFPTIPVVEFSESVGFTPTVNDVVGELEPSYASTVLLPPTVVGTVMVSLAPVVTVVAKSNALPVHVLLAPIVMPALSISVPTKVVSAPSVVAAPGVQNTPEACAPLVSRTWVLAVWPSAPVLLKT